MRKRINELMWRETVIQIGRRNPGNPRISPKRTWRIEVRILAVRELRIEKSIARKRDAYDTPKIVPDLVAGHEDSCGEREGSKST